MIYVLQKRIQYNIYVYFNPVNVNNKLNVPISEPTTLLTQNQYAHL